MAKFKNIMIRILSIAFTVFVIVVLFIYSHKYNNRNISDVKLEVVAQENRLMLIDTLLMEFLSGEIDEFTGRNIKLLDHQLILDKLYRLEAVDTVYISCGVTGALLIEVIQKNPVAKVYLSKSDIKFLTDRGELIKSPYYGEELIIVSGNITDETYMLINFIEEDKFFKAITESIFIDKNKRHLLSTNYIEQPVSIGEIVDLEEKSDNLRYFLEAVGEKVEAYRELNLNYKNQIVAIKK
ncbi:MAG: hypothetical protein LBP67_03200 [Bacteroidales bacterium]|jgi:hypothetical protein|nr:hypothetical protein [Bacteroidales bacterium]